MFRRGTDHFNERELIPKTEPKITQGGFSIKDIGHGVFYEVKIPTGAVVNLTVNMGIKSVTQPDDRTLLIGTRSRNSAVYWISRFIEDNVSIEKPEPEPVSYPKFTVSLTLVCISFFMGVCGFAFSILESGYFYLKAWYLPSAQSAFRAATAVLILVLTKYLINNPPNWALRFSPERGD